MQVNSVIDVAAGTVNVNNTNSGFAASTLEINGGSLTTGTINVSANKDAGVLKIQGGALTTGTLNVNDNGAVTVSSGSLNSSAIVVKGGKDTTIDPATNAGVTPGTMTVSNGAVNVSGTTSVQTDTNGPGVLTLGGGTYDSAGFNVQGTMNASGATITSTGAFTSSGTTSVTAGTLATGANTITVSGGNFNVNGGAVTSSSTLSLSGTGAMNVSTGSVTLDRPTSGNFTATAAGTGTLNVDGGTFTVAGAAAGTDTIQFQNGTINVSNGGIFSSVEGQTFFSSDTAFNIIGSGATITIDRLNQAASAGRDVNFNFVFDATGVSSIDQGSASYATLAGATLNIDGSAYTGEPATFNLFNYNNITSEAGAVNIIGFGAEGVGYTFEQSSVDNFVCINVLIPEPSSSMMIILGMSGLFLRRKVSRA